MAQGDVLGCSDGRGHGIHDQEEIPRLAMVIGDQNLHGQRFPRRDGLDGQTLYRDPMKVTPGQLRRQGQQRQHNAAHHIEPSGQGIGSRCKQKNGQRQQ
jgi:hypothetical protein